MYPIFKHMEKVIVLVGPTAIGKTSLSIKLAKDFNMEIISGDSVQVYRHLNIGSGKIKEEEKQGIPHHLIDILEPNESYSVNDFQVEARRIINNLKGKSAPFVVGGTGFYIRALLYNYEFLSDKRRDSFDDLSNEELYNRLLSLNDPSIPDLNNRKRLLRHLEVLSSGFNPNKKDEKMYDYLIIGLTAPREVIYDRINKRVDEMINDGLVKEVESLYNDYKDFMSLSAIGYKELFPYFENQITLDDAIEKIKQHSRNFAKRQLTYFNNQFKINWIDITKEDPYIKSKELIKDFLSNN